MPRCTSRIELMIKNVRVERLHDISDEDAKAEGVWSGLESEPMNQGEYKKAFEMLWSFINGDDSWGSNPWVWVVDFERIKP